MPIGMDSWPDTAGTLRHIHRVAQAEGYRIDRAGICLDRRPCRVTAPYPGRDRALITSPQSGEIGGRAIPAAWATS